MLYTPQRRHVVSNLSATVQLLNLTQHFLSPNLLVLGCRIAIMIQINAAGFIHPERSLLLLAFFVTLLNFVAGALHVLEWAAGTLDGSGLILDFIGQSRPPSILHVLFLDLLIWAIQITALTISYVNNRGNGTPTPGCPWKDPLLPSRDLEEEVVEDMEDGLAGKGDDILDEELWLDEQEAEMEQSDERGRLLEPSRARRRREIPLVMSLSLPHMLNIIYRLPTPLAAPSVVSSIVVDTNSPAPSIHTRRGSEETIRPRRSEQQEVVFDASEETSGALGRERTVSEGPAEQREVAAGSPGRAGRTGRIPGDYWVSGPDRGQA